MINKELLSKIIYDNNTGSNSQIDFDSNLSDGKYKIYYYYKNGNIKSYRSIEIIFEGSINLYLDGSIVVDGANTLLECRGVYITRDKLINSRDSIITFSSNGCTRTNNVNINVYITRIEKIN